MSSLPSVDVLRLVQAISRSGAVGTAARELRISQPSASQRLARMERMCGTKLFERDTRGARPTAAGAELSRRADHILGHLEEVYAATREAATGHRLVIGDRKSTRLNSSHVRISYAVFCLKKKKQYKINAQQSQKKTQKQQKN